MHTRSILIKLGLILLFFSFFLWYYVPDNKYSFKKYLYNFNTPPLGCKIPDINPWYPGVLKVLKPRKLPLICNQSKPQLSFMTDGLLKFHQNRIAEYQDCVDLLNNNCSYTINCTYTCIQRGTGDGAISHGPVIAIHLNQDTKIDCEFSQVNCYQKDNNTMTDSETLIYASGHSQIVTNESRLEELDEILPVDQRKKYHNVFLFVLDSVSRLNFERYCPKTMKLLENLFKSVNFKGMTRHGGGSWDNAVAFLAGKNWKNYSNEVVYQHYWDDWPLIWKNYSQKGYLTLDDQDGLGNIFLYLKMGFEQQPTDHRYRVFWIAASRLYNYSTSEYSDPCYRNQAKHNMQFEYLRQFLTKYEGDRPKFILFWNAALCHDSSENLAYLDDDFSNFLQANHDLLKESFLFVMSDHGDRFGSVVSADLGHFERDLSLLTVAVPENVRKEEPSLLQNMQLNSKLLVSHYDTFVTLQDILESQGEDWKNIHKQNDWSHLKVHITKPQSYLRPFDPSRTCEQAGIPPDTCICQKQIHYISRETNFTIVGQLSKKVVDELNTIVSAEKQCSRLNVSKILKLDELSAKSSYEKYKDKKQTFRISIQVTPSNGTFEANVRYDGYSGYEIDGEVKRTNRYGNQFYCIAKTNPGIKPYCFCG